MTYHLFHHNMENYAGGPAPRQQLYQQAYARTRAAATILAPPQILAAGFTELTNRDRTMHSLDTALVGALDPGLRMLAVIACGASALGTKEYLGIAMGRPGGAGTAFNVHSVGRVRFTVTGQQSRPIHDYFPPAPKDWTVIGPSAGLQQWGASSGADSTPDYRYPVYVVGSIGPQTAVGTRVPRTTTLAKAARPSTVIAVAWFHNRYKGSADSSSARDSKAAAERLIAMQQLPTVVKAIMSENPFTPDYVFIGGDFNSPANQEPGHQYIGTDRVARLRTFSASAPPLLSPPGFFGPGSVLVPGGPATAQWKGGTTRGGNLYDYWFMGQGATAPPWPAGFPVPSACMAPVTARGAPIELSDHAATFLEVL